jgi:hypothetical protein
MAKAAILRAGVYLRIPHPFIKEMDYVSYDQELALAGSPARCRVPWTPSSRVELGR